MLFLALRNYWMVPYHRKIEGLEEVRENKEERKEEWAEIDEAKKYLSKRALTIKIVKDYFLIIFLGNV